MTEAEWLEAVSQQLQHTNRYRVAEGLDPLDLSAVVGSRLRRKLDLECPKASLKDEQQQPSCKPPTASGVLGRPGYLS